jgi:hypothetical protein
LKEGFLPDNFCDDDIGPGNSLGTFDVICGRCSTAFNNIGNQRFRATISKNVQRYIDAPTRAHKSKVILSVTELLQNDLGARFFKFKKGNYVELDNKTILEKVGHALRDMAAQKIFGTTTASRSSFSSVGSSISFKSNQDELSVESAQEEDRFLSKEVKSNIEAKEREDSNSLEWFLIFDDLSVEEDISVTSTEVFPDIVTPETPRQRTQQEIFGIMVNGIDNLNLDFDGDEEEDLMDLMRHQFVAEKSRY